MSNFLPETPFHVKDTSIYSDQNCDHRHKKKKKKKNLDKSM